MKWPKIVSVLVLVLTPWVAFASDSDASLGIEGVELQEGEKAPTDGLFLSLAEVRELDRLLADLEGRARVAEAKLADAEAQAALESAKLVDAQIRLAASEATLAAERVKQPTFLERHIGGCLGVGAGYDGQDVIGGVVLAYGWRF